MKLAMISYVSPTNEEVTQLAVVGENTVFLLESRDLGFAKNTTPRGSAAKWLADAVLKQIKEG